MGALFITDGSIVNEVTAMYKVELDDIYLRGATINHIRLEKLAKKILQYGMATMNVVNFPMLKMK